MPSQRRRAVCGRARFAEAALLASMFAASAVLVWGTLRTVGATDLEERSAHEVAEPQRRARRAVEPPPVVRVAADPGSSLLLTLPDAAFPSEAALFAGSFSARGRIGVHDVSIRVTTTPRTPSAETEPEDLTDADERLTGKRFDERFLVEGGFGWTPYAEVAIRVPSTGTASGSAPGSTTDAATGPAVFSLAGLFERHEWRVVVECSPAPDDRARDRILAMFCSGVSARGPRRDPSWTDEEIEQRLAREIPDPALRGLLSARRRTEHFLIVGEAGAVAAIAPSAEAAHESVRRLYPFQEVRGRRLLPVFVFPSREDYREFGRAGGLTERFLAGAAGHARDDLWVSFGRVGPRVVHHETAHQLVSMRVRQRGGGSWWQEGLAEYAEMPAAERASIGRRVLRARSVPSFRELLRIASLLDDERWPASTTYPMAASVVAFLRDGPWGRERFDDLRSAMSRVRRGDAEGACTAFREVYGIEFEDAEDDWRAWASR